MADPDQLLWPLRAVSKDATNLTKLDADGNVLTSTADVDARYVQKAGDTMTGRLVLNAPSTIAVPDGHFQIVGGDGFNPVLSEQGTGDVNGTATPAIRFARSRGTVAAPAHVQTGDNLGNLQFLGRRPDGAFAQAASIVGRCDLTPLAGATNVRGHIAFLVNTGTGLPATSMVVYGDSVTIGVPLSVASIAGNIVMPSGTIFVQSGAITINRVGTDANGNTIGCSVTVSGAGKVNTGVVAEVSGGTDGSYGFRTGGTNASPTDYGIFGAAAAQNYFRGHTGIGIIQPQHQLEVGGDTVMRGPLEVTGNITSTGTGHSFVTGSIPSSVVIGNTPRTIFTTGQAGVAGQMVWDDNFLYLHVLGAWKKIPLSAI